LTFTALGSTVTVTPLGTAIGCLPIRDIARPHHTEQSSSPPTPRCLASRSTSTPTGVDSTLMPRPPRNGRDLFLADVDSQARPADALDAGDHWPTLLIVLERHAQLFAGALADDGRVAEEAFRDQYARDGVLHSGPRNVDPLFTRRGCRCGCA
jgi:hypothetical protein